MTKKLILLLLGLCGIALFLYLGVGLRIQLRGDGIGPILVFGSEQEHYANLTQHRKEQGSSNDANSSGWTPKFGANAEEWTKFRGPRMDGHYRERSILTDWPPGGPALLWKQPIGSGYASFVVANGRAFTVEQRRDQEVAVAYDILSGTELWTNSWQADFRETMGGPGPRATPTWDDKRLYFLGATGVFRAIDDQTGHTFWERNILEDAQAKNLQWGMAASPLVLDEIVVLQPGGANGRSIIAYDKLSGKLRWNALDDPQAYTSPMFVTLGGQPQLLTASRDRIIGLSVEAGTLLWSYPWKVSFGVSVAQPLLLGENRVFFSAGYGHGATVLQVNENQGIWNINSLWENRFMKNRFSSSVFHEDFIYGLDERILTCLDAKTGKRMWKGGRYGHGQILLASDHLVVLSENGTIVLLKATPDGHRELHQFQGIGGKTWNVPVLAGGILLVRNATEMAAFDLRVTQ